MSNTTMGSKLLRLLTTLVMLLMVASSGASASSFGTYFIDDRLKISPREVSCPSGRVVLRFYYHSPHETRLEVWAPSFADKSEPVHHKEKLYLSAGWNELTWDCDNGYIPGTYTIWIVPVDAPQYAFSNKVRVTMDKLSPTLDWPVRARISSYYGPRKFSGGNFHYAIDLAAPLDTPIRAAAGGTVVYVAESSVGGWGVVIDDFKGVRTEYYHVVEHPPVRVGQRVSRGDVIAYVGDTGIVTGAHLHFVVKIDGEHQNPLNYLP